MICAAINKERIFRPAPPRIRSRPGKEMVRRGESVRLRCEAEGDEPIRISWLAKGASLNDSKDSRFLNNLIDSIDEILMISAIFPGSQSFDTLPAPREGLLPFQSLPFEKLRPGIGETLSAWLCKDFEIFLLENVIIIIIFRN